MVLYDTTIYGRIQSVSIMTLYDRIRLYSISACILMLDKCKSSRLYIKSKWLLDKEFLYSD